MIRCTDRTPASGYCAGCRGAIAAKRRWRARHGRWQHYGGHDDDPRNGQPADSRHGGPGGLFYRDQPYACDPVVVEPRRPRSRPSGRRLAPSPAAPAAPPSGPAVPARQIGYPHKQIDFVVFVDLGVGDAFTGVVKCFKLPIHDRRIHIHHRRRGLILGKGSASAALAALLQARGYKVRLRKLDYLNVDPGTMSPTQHGEVFVTDDGAETDLDLGHYERFTGVPARKTDNVTTGRIYTNVIEKERRGAIWARYVQVIPHVTDAIKEFTLSDVHDEDFVLCEIGGTVGDIEGPCAFSKPSASSATNLARHAQCSSI